jgi:nitroimidazol reductase NimA-like FMN-containing flavoprotein (pyridoxamine 5'-phosphate oxidase superfamily)
MTDSPKATSLEQRSAASAGDAAAAAPPPSDRVRLRRRRERGRHERAVIDAILDEGLIAHLGIVDASGQPFVIPTLHARHGDVVYLHGSAAGRAMKTLARGAPACLTVSLLDGLVLARSAMHHSANYRSVMLLGTARPLEDARAKRAALEAVVEHVVPGRWSEVRPPSDNELKSTSVLELTIDEASAKIRTGPPVDDEEDYALATWAGVLPLRTVTAAPLADERTPAHIAVPDSVRCYARPGAGAQPLP